MVEELFYFPFFFFQHAADVNVVNDTGDTPLHKAAYTGREVCACDHLNILYRVFICQNRCMVSHNITTQFN